MAKTYKSEAMAAVHEMVEGFHESGAVDEQTMRKFDEACLTPASLLTPDEIKAIRQKEAVSQPVFARHLNVSKNLEASYGSAEGRAAGDRMTICPAASTAATE